MSYEPEEKVVFLRLPAGLTEEATCFLKEAIWKLAEVGFPELFALHDGGSSDFQVRASITKPEELNPMLLHALVTVTATIQKIQVQRQLTYAFFAPASATSRT